MITALGALAQRVGPEDTAIVYFSGHGIWRPTAAMHSSTSCPTTLA